MKGLLILTEIRSGSSWAGSLTNRTGQLGCADEHLRLLSRSESQNIADEYEWVLNRCSTDNGVFAIKIFPDQLNIFRNRYGYDFIERCVAEHDVTIVLLDRKDRLGQAISAVKALRSEQWSLQKARGESAQTADRIGDYDFDDIFAAIETISESMAYWRTYLAAHDWPFHPVFYEDIVDDKQAYVQMIARYLGVALQPSDLDADKFLIQRDEISESWRARFREDYLKLANSSEIGRKVVLTRNIRTFLNIALKRPLRLKKNSLSKTVNKAAK